MTVRGLVTSAARRQNRSHRCRRTALLGVAIASACALLAPSAYALVVQQEGRSYGVTPIHGVAPSSISGAYRAAPSARARPYDGLPEGGGPLVYRGGPVMHSVRTHLIYWDPSSQFTPLTREIFAGFFAGVAADSGKPTNSFAIAGQYSDGAGNAAYSSTFAGEVLDKTAYPPSGCTAPAGFGEGPFTRCLTDVQLRAHLKLFVTEQKLPTGPSEQYFLMTPHPVVTCTDLKSESCSNNVYCAYHSVIEPGAAGEIVYSDIPFTLLDPTDAKGCQDDGQPLQHPNGDTEGLKGSTRYADVALKYTSHEYIEAATDPHPFTGGLAWVDENGLEIGDKCNGIHPTEGPNGIGYDANAFLPVLGGNATEGTLVNQLVNGRGYYLQSEWDNGAAGCTMQPLPISGASFTATPAGAAPGTPIAFRGAATDRYGALTYSWSFGDGSGAGGQAPSHVYATTGAYRVTMTVRDLLTGATAASVTQTIAINDAPTAAFGASPSPATAGAPVSFDASQSRDPDGSITSYSWSFGDGAGASSGPTASHTFTTPGTYSVKLSVTDSAQQSAVVEHTVTVAAAPATVARLRPPIQGLSARFNSRTGAVTLSGTINGAGAVSWLATFPNGSFGAFSAAGKRCRAGQVRLQGACRPARVVFAKGSLATLGGTFRLVLRPTPSALRALKAAFRRRRPLPVSVSLTFRPVQGAPSSSWTRVLAVGLRRG